MSIVEVEGLVGGIKDEEPSELLTSTRLNFTCCTPLECKKALQRNFPPPIGKVEMLEFISEAVYD
jgi:hypothetical protein